MYNVATENKCAQLKEKAICEVQTLKMGVGERTGCRVPRSAQPWGSPGATHKCLPSCLYEGDQTISERGNCEDAWVGECELPAPYLRKLHELLLEFIILEFIEVLLLLLELAPGPPKAGNQLTVRLT